MHAVDCSTVVMHVYHSVGQIRIATLGIQDTLVCFNSSEVCSVVISLLLKCTVQENMPWKTQPYLLYHNLLFLCQIGAS